MTLPELAVPAAIYALAEFEEMQDYITEDLEKFAYAALEAALPYIREQVYAELQNPEDGCVREAK